MEPSPGPRRRPRRERPAVPLVEHSREPIRAIGDDPVDAPIEKPAHVVLFVHGPDVHGDVVGVELPHQPRSEHLLSAVPLYQINENATLDQGGKLDDDSRVAQRIGRRYGIPVFLKTFGTDVAYRTDRGEGRVDVYVSEAMTRQMAQLRNIAGAAWSPHEREYRPTLFAQGGPVRPVWFPYRNRLAE